MTSSPSGALLSVEGAAGVCGDKVMREPQPHLGSRQQTEGPDGREWGGTNGLWGQGDGCTNAGTCLGVTEPPWKSQELEESQPAVEQGVMLSEARCLEIPQRAGTELAETWSGAQRGWQWEVRR